ncbi:DUF6252 family protein [Algoriphagus sp.]|uniref:DUF6252 family protein n=1 Tax=Algoriphagus sp. TaxID=1872435 RepID=UPI00391AAC44
MKNLLEILRSAFLLFFFIAFISCSSDDGQDPKGAAEEFSGDVAGVGSISASKDFDTISGTKISTGTITVISLQGTDNSGKGFMLRFTAYNGPGTYDLGFTNIANSATFINGVAAGQQFSTGYQGTSGKIVVTVDDGKRMEGTFEFVGKVNNTSAAMTVTNGKFKVNLQ